MRRLSPGRLAFLLFLAGLVSPLFLPGARAADSEKITFESFDKVELQGDWYPSNKGAKARCALVIHKLGGDRKQMAPIAEELQKAGFAVLAPDLRGHGASKSVTASDFWKVGANQRGIKKAGASAKKLDEIDFKEFSNTYYSFLVNDLVACKIAMEKKNNARECNINDLVIVGAEDGATLGAMWLFTEWDRRKPFINGMGMIQLGEPEGKDIAAVVALSLRPDLGSGTKTLNLANNIPAFYTGQGLRDGEKIREKTGFCFFYGKEDASAASITKRVYDMALQADKYKLKLTYKVELKTKLAGAALLAQEGLDVEPLIIKYLNDKVFEARKDTLWGEREVKNYNPTEVNLRKFSIPSP
jgi:pimeloyl-ACP methyl ester carboxylesterase